MKTHPSPATRSTLTFVVVGFAFLLSGGSALAYQIVWQRLLSQEIGVDAISVAITVSIFMLGLAIGTHAGRNLAETTSRPFSLYALAELLIALYAFGSYWILKFVPAPISLLIENRSYLVDFIVYGGLLLPPTILMGVGVPIIMRAVAARGTESAQAFGLLYGANIFGAFLGTIWASFWTIELFGLSGTLTLFAFLNLFVPAFMIPFLWHELQSPPKTRALTQESSLETRETSTSPQFGSRLLMPATGAVLYGFVTLSLEITMFRVLSHYFGVRASLFPLLLAAFLLNMAVGEWIGATISRYHRATSQSILILASAGLIALLAIFHIPEPFLLSIGIDQGLAKRPKDLTTLFVVVFVALIPILLLSALLPLFIKRAATPGVGGETIVGRILLYSTTGNFVGAAITGLVLLPNIGTYGTSLVIAITLLCAVAIYVERSRLHMAIVATAAATFILLFPNDYYSRFSDYANANTYPIDVREDDVGVLSAYDTGHKFLTARMNRSPTANIPFDVDNFALNRTNFGYLAALDPDFDPKDVLVVGLGSSNFI